MNGDGNNLQSPPPVGDTPTPPPQPTETPSTPEAMTEEAPPQGQGEEGGGGFLAQLMKMLGL